MKRGQVYFDLSFADSACTLPVVTTLVYLGETGDLGGGVQHEFLELDQLIVAQSQLNVRLLDVAQVGDLLRVQDLTHAVSKSAGHVSEEWLEALGL